MSHELVARQWKLEADRVADTDEAHERPWRHAATPKTGNDQYGNAPSLRKASRMARNSG